MSETPTKPPPMPQAYNPATPSEPSGRVKGNHAVALLHQFLDELSIHKGLSSHTRRAYQHDILSFLTVCARNLQTTPERLSPDDLSTRVDLPLCRIWLADRAEAGAGVATRARAVSALKAFYRWGERQGLFENAYLDLLRLPKKPKRLPRPVSTDNAQKLMHTTADDNAPAWVKVRDLAVLSLMYGAGLRIGEVVGMPLSAMRPLWQGQSWVTPSKAPALMSDIIVRGKGDKERNVPLLPVVVEAIADYLPQCPYIASALPESSASTPLFFGMRGKRLHPDLVRARMRIVRKQLQLPETASPHALRHSFATHLLQNGADLRSIQELLGHTSLRATQVYTEIHDAQLLDAYHKFHPRQ